MDQDEDDRFEGEDLSGLQEFVHQEDDLDVCPGIVDESDPE